MTSHGLPRSAVLRTRPERYPGEADDYEAAWAEFTTALGPHPDPRDFVWFCRQSPQGSAAHRWFTKWTQT